MKISLVAAAAFAFAAFQISSSALAAPAPAQAVVKPTSDGSLYVCAGCNVVSDGAYLMAAGYIQGDVKFSMAGLRQPQSQVLLTLNPYGEPLFGKDVAVYGFGTSTGALAASDANAGTYIGTLVLPDNLGYGQDATFDVTAFVNSVRSDYVAFNLRTPARTCSARSNTTMGIPPSCWQPRPPCPNRPMRRSC